MSPDLSSSGGTRRWGCGAGTEARPLVLCGSGAAGHRELGAEEPRGAMSANPPPPARPASGILRSKAAISARLKPSAITARRGLTSAFPSSQPNAAGAARPPGRRTLHFAVRQTKALVQPNLRPKTSVSAAPGWVGTRSARGSGRGEVRAKPPLTGFGHGSGDGRMEEPRAAQTAAAARRRMCWK